MYVVNQNNKRFGTFSSLPETLQIKSDCDDGTTVTHKSSEMKKPTYTLSWNAGEESGQATVRALVVRSLTDWYVLDNLQFDLASTNPVGIGGGGTNSTNEISKNAIIASLEGNALFSIVVGVITVIYIIGAILEALIKRQRAQEKSITKKVVGRF
jgi:hypothetical protein